MRSRALLFRPDSAYTRLRVAWGSPEQRVQDYFRELKQRRDDPYWDKLSTQISKLLPKRELRSVRDLVRVRGVDEASLDNGGLVLETPLYAAARVRGWGEVPSFVVLTADDKRAGLKDDRFRVDVSGLPAHRETLISIVSPGMIKFLRERDQRPGRGKLQGRNEVELLDAAFSDDLLVDLDAARIVSAAPTLMTETDDDGRAHAEVSVEPGTPPLPGGTFVVVAVAEPSRS